MTMGEGPDAVRVSTVWATASLLELLHARPAIGRYFTADEDRIGASGVAVLGYGFWQSMYSGDPNVMGRTISIRGEDFTVIGITPKGFHGVDLRRVDVWLPLHVAGSVYYDTGWWTVAGGTGPRWSADSGRA